MWKYKCKSQFISLTVAFLVGVGLMFFTLSNDAVLSSGILPSEALVFIQEYPIAMYLAGGFTVAGIVNVLLVGQLVINQFHISPFLIFLFLMALPDMILLVGVVLVIPMYILSIYGMVSLKTAYTTQMKSRNLTNDEELVRIYSIHHKLDENYKEMGTQIRKNVNKVTLIYVLGIVALFFVMLLVNNLWLVMGLLFFYMMAFNYLLRYRASLFTPIASLLYEKCDPEACASAIIYYSTRRKKIKLTQQTLLAQCLLYLDDPQLAQDVLISYPKKDPSSILTYWSLISYSSYLLKDEDALVRAKEEASKVKMHFGQTGVFIRSEELASIENKIHLMDGDFNESKKFYLNALKKAVFPFQQVDASYYIALISFVQEDYSLAQMYFEKVVQLGNKMYFVEKAKAYLNKIERMNLQNETEYESY